MQIVKLILKEDAQLDLFLMGPRVPVQLLLRLLSSLLLIFELLGKAVILGLEVRELQLERNSLVIELPIQVLDLVVLLSDLLSETLSQP